MNTLTPAWNELWYIKNVPITAQLNVEVLDKDNGPTDDYIGRFHCDVSAGTKELEIESALLKRTKGTFWLKVPTSYLWPILRGLTVCQIESKPPSMPAAPPYCFDGPIRFSCHSSPAVGHLTNLNDKRLYSTWKMFIKGAPIFFGDMTQHWNVNYKAAQTIFGHTPASLAVRSSIQVGHKMLYARSTNNGFGIIEKPADLLQIFVGGSGGKDGMPPRVKPAVYTYVISAEDYSFRFSETGAAFFVDFASKHALHANCAESVCYSGEFHPRPEGGWAQFSDDTPDDLVKWELVIDNNSGTYSPNKDLLPILKELLEYNFPGFGIIALDHEDPALKQSREACREYALKFRGVKQEELQPHAQPGDETLLHYIQAGNPIETGPYGRLA